MAGESLRRTDAKAFFANERTFLHWMNMAVTIGSISAALAGVSGHAHRHWGDEFSSQAVAVRILSLTMLSVAIIIALYAGFNFHMRANMLQLKLDGPYDNRTLPILLALALIGALSAVFAGAASQLKKHAAA